MQPHSAASLYSDVTLASVHLAYIALILASSFLLATYLGYRTGRTRRNRLLADEQEIGKRVSETTQGAFLALLGLLLAFAFGNSLSISQTMKIAATDEAAALGTAFLRADYLAEPGRTELRTALLDYAATRILPTDDRIDTQEELTAWLETSLNAQNRLWPLTLSATKEPTPPAIQAFVAGAINDAIDAHLYRVASQSVPIAAFVQVVVLVATITAIFLLANRAGMLGRSLTWRMFAFALLTGLIIYMIVDIRRGYEGLIQVYQNELRATIYDMEQALGTP